MGRLSLVAGLCQRNKILILAGILVPLIALAAVIPDDLTVQGNISVTGTVDGRDVAADGLITDALDTALGDITSTEADQIENIGSTTISADIWGYLANATSNLCGINQSCTLTNKTLTSPVISTITNTGTITLPTSTDTLVGRDTTDTLTNKTLTSPAINGANLNFGTASNTNRILLPSETTAGLDALTDTAGLLAYDLDLAKPVYNDGSEWTAIGTGTGGGSGGKNYAEAYYDGSSIDDINGYDDGDSATPTDGTGGTLDGVSIGLNQDTELRPDANQRISKDANDRRGEGRSFDFTLDAAERDSGLPLYIQFRYQTSADYDNGDLRLFIYDKDGTTLLNVSGGYNGDGSIAYSEDPTLFTGWFQPTKGNDDYRFIWHVTSENTDDWEFNFIDLKISPDTVQPGAFVADLGTETWVDSEANSTTSVRLNRVGNRLFVDGIVSVTGAFSGSTFTVTIPSSYAADSTTYPTGKTYEVGTNTLTDAATSTYQGYASLTSATSLRLFAGNVASTYYFGTNPAATTPFTWANGDSMQFQASWIVDGWEASGSLSTTETLMRGAMVVASRSTTQQSIASGSNVTIIFDTETKDTLGAYNNATGEFTLPKTACYWVAASLVFADSTAWTEGENLNLLLNDGSNDIFFGFGRGLDSSGASNNQAASGITLWCGDKDDVWTVKAAQGSGSTLNTTATAFRTTLAIAEYFDPTVFGVMGEYDYREVEITTSTSTTTADTPVDVSGATLSSLPPGTWSVCYSVPLRIDENGGGTVSISAQVYLTDSSNNRVDMSTVYVSDSGLASSVIRTSQASTCAEVTITSATTYKLRVNTDLSTANAVATVAGNSLAGSMTNPDAEGKLWARKMR